MKRLHNDAGYKMNIHLNRVNKLNKKRGWVIRGGDGGSITSWHSYQVSNDQVLSLQYSPISTASCYKSCNISLTLPTVWRKYVGVCVLGIVLLLLNLLV